MLLINKIKVSKLKNYRQKYLECLKQNISNSIISKIVIFVDDPSHDIPNLHGKVDIHFKKNISIYDLINSVKKLYSTDILIWVDNPIIGFNSDLYKTSTDTKDYVVTNSRKDYFIFKSDTPLSDVPTSEGIFSLKRKNVELSFFRKKITDEEQVTPGINIKRTEKPITPVIATRRPNKIESPEKKKFKKDLGIPDLIRKKSYVPETKESYPVQIENAKLDIVVVSVNYNDLLIVSLQHNSKIFENITVVTSEDDILCQKICQKFRVNCVVTNVMYENGDVFNKGKAINEGIKSLINPDFILLIDADIIIKNKIEINSFDRECLYTSDRWFCKSYQILRDWQEGRIPLEKIGRKEGNKGIGFFQLFNINSKSIDKESPYPDVSKNAAWSDLVFRDKFTKREDIRNTIIHLGESYKNWDGRVSNKFLTDDQFVTLLDRKPDYTICSFYFNYNNDWRQKRNFIKFLEQWKDHYDNMIVGIFDYGDIDFEIPCEKIIIEGDVNKRIWSKEIIINKIVDKVDTDYILWIDGDVIYENLDWLNNLEAVIGDNDFVQLFETINYLGEDGDILESHKSLCSGEENNVDYLLGKGFKPGGSWMTRTRLLKSKPLFEKMIVGGGDTILAYGLWGTENGWTLERVKEGSVEVYEEAKKWIKNFGKRKCGYLSVNVNHLYHGDLKNRNYNERYNSLSKVKQTIGIMLISFGFNYEKITPKCVESIRRFTNIPITIHTNIPDFIRSSDFDKFYDVNFLLYDMNDDENRVIKTQLSKFSEYDRTIYIDVDSEILSIEFLELFDFLDDYEIISPLWKNISVGKLESMSKKSKRYSDFYEVIKESNINNFNFIAGGICAFRKTKIVNKFFEDFYKNWIYFGRKQDMPALNRSIIKFDNKIKIKILDNKRYNLTDSTIIKSNHNIKEETYKGMNFIRHRYNPKNDKFEYVESDKEVYFTKKKICFLYDTPGWAFYNKSHNLKKYLNDKYEIFIMDYRKVSEENNYDVIINFSPNLLKNINLKNVIHGISSKKNLSLYDEISNFKITHTNNKRSYELLKNENKFLLYNGVNTNFYFFRQRKLNDIIRIGAVGSDKMLEHKGYYRIKDILFKTSDICEDKLLFVDSENPKSASEMRTYYQNIDILLISSVDENTPNPLLEAMSCGVPVITNDTGMAQELIIDGQNGFIINNFNDLESYIEKIKFLQNNRDIYESFSKLSRISVENFSWEKMAIKYEEMINLFLKINN